mmetsp:Transcript_15357/g.25041  ORF Transcript_15357/g.25041 Transcript_15357/m.25041 type:complete len:386 (+) Transcript_15357:359-1516(+)
MFSGLIDQYKKELGEFVSTVADDTSSALNTAKEKLATLGADDDNDQQNSSINAIQLPDIETFMDIDLSQDGSYADFKEAFDFSSRVEDVESLKEDNESLYNAFVPSTLTHEEFWTRYFYYQQVQRRARLLAGDMNIQDDDDLSWGDDEEEQETESRDEDVGSLSDDDQNLKRAVVAEAKCESLQKQVEHMAQQLETLQEENGALKMKIRALVEVKTATEEEHVLPMPTPPPTSAIESKKSTSMGTDHVANPSEQQPVSKDIINAPLPPATKEAHLPETRNTKLASTQQEPSVQASAESVDQSVATTQEHADGNKIGTPKATKEQETRADLPDTLTTQTKDDEKSSLPSPTNQALGAPKGEEKSPKQTTTPAEGWEDEDDEWAEWE